MLRLRYKNQTPMKSRIPIIMLLLLATLVYADEPVTIHPAVGTTATDGHMRITLTAKIQNLAVNPQKDKDIKSPKSANFAPDDHLFAINSLEGCRTPFYRTSDLQKLFTIRHHFTLADSALWSNDGMTFDFVGEHATPQVFDGKPVEGVFSHGGKYFWVPYYRRSFDTNAQEPSALAVVDITKGKIVRLFNTGVLPKMITCSHDGRHIAVTHWGDNTVATIDCSDKDPMAWKYTNLYVVDYRFAVKVEEGDTINRDMGSGYALRGTVFTNNDEYLLVGCMGGKGGIAVIDLKNQKYLGRLTGMMSNVRHLLIDHEYLYISINKTGHVQKIEMTEVMKAIAQFSGTQKTVKVSGWKAAKVGAGARTICVSPDGKYIFVACNFANCVSVIDTKLMKEVTRIEADSYPVGMDISSDGKTLIVTSQGRKDRGGNSVDIFTIDYR